MSGSEDNWRTLEDRYLLSTYSKLPICIERGEGCFVYDMEGTEYLDMYGGHCVTSTGHCHPSVVAAIQKQAARLIFYSNATYNRCRAEAVGKLVGMCGESHQRAFFVNSGAEANENAIKLARAVTGRRVIVSSEGAFHGRTYGSLSATGIEHYRGYLNTPVPDHKIVPIEKVVENVTQETAGVIVEPIQSMGGVIEVGHHLLRSIEQACRENGALLIFDEVQTGVGRTGSFLYSQQIGVSPDLSTLAKGIASGYSVGAVLLTEDVARGVKVGDLGSTFGGSPLGCAAIRATLEVIKSENLLGNAAFIGNYLTERLRGFEEIDEVRGKGLLIGLKFKNKNAQEVQRSLLQRKILTGGSSDPKVLRLMPALVLGQGEADRFLEALQEVVAQPSV